VSAAPEVEIIILEGLQPYGVVLEMQRARQRAVAANTLPNALFLVEHRPTITLGRNTDPRHLLHSPEAYAAQGIDVEVVERGGDVTYHGPGQLVAYPILNLHDWRCSVGWYLRTLEETIIQVLDTYGLKGERIEGLTGVWVDGAKVAAVGIGLHHWVSIHGIALNITPDLGHFSLIVPCGIADKPVTSMAALLPHAPPLPEVQDRFLAAFKASFEIP